MAGWTFSIQYKVFCLSDNGEEKSSFCDESACRENDFSGGEPAGRVPHKGEHFSWLLQAEYSPSKVFLSLGRNQKSNWFLSEFHKCSRKIYVCHSMSENGLCNRKKWRPQRLKKSCNKWKRLHLFNRILVELAVFGQHRVSFTEVYKVWHAIEINYYEKGW